MSVCIECNQAQANDDPKYCESCLNATKICRKCQIEKSIFNFDKNQKTISGKVSRRGSCISCRKNKKTIPPQIRRDYEAKNPKKKIGEQFHCPVCQTTFIRQYTNDVILDHDHNTSITRGYICRNCNSAIGLFEEDPRIISRALDWVTNKLKI